MNYSLLDASEIEADFVAVETNSKVPSLLGGYPKNISRS